MAVSRIVRNAPLVDRQALEAFYGGILGLEVAMDHGWIITFAGVQTSSQPQVSFASEGGSGTPIPDLSIEIDDFEETLERFAQAGIELEYGPVIEPWGVRRFYVRDPAGQLINILSHSQIG